ncbi:MAG: aldehyde ferredoxin oxidoreductase family protein [Thermodesulfobacteriota bacterium]
MNTCGCNSKVLHVDLTTGEFVVEEPSEDFYRKYLGGSAMNMYYMLHEMKTNAKPLGSENVLCLSVGVVTGAPVSGQSRMTATAKSPLTGAIGDAQSGGFFPAEMKFAGFDAFIIKGKSSYPVYLWVHDGKYELRDARHLWGKVTGETESIIRTELSDDKIEVAQVGPAGENGVLFASIINGCNRANGRTGMGAVMAAKNLKAVAVRGVNGRNTFRVADRRGVVRLAKYAAQQFEGSSAVLMRKYGTAATIGAQQAAGGLPSYNFNSGVFDKWESIDGTTMYEKILKGADSGEQDRHGNDTCYGCIVQCKRVVEVTEGPYKIQPRYGGPEYETSSAFGNYCGVDDLKAVAYANQLCNQYGMDTISCGATIAWAMEAFENGKLTREDFNGIDLKFGNAEGMVEITEMIAKAQGFGQILGQGSHAAAKIIGQGTEAYLTTSHKMEAPAHMPQLKRSLALMYAVNPFGADHESSEHDPPVEGCSVSSPERMALLGITQPMERRSLGPDKVRYARITQYLYSAMNSMSVCVFVYGASWQLLGPQELCDLVKSVTGWDMSIDELLLVGERSVNMQRAFNAREGFDRKQDRLPKKFFTKALKGGKSDGLFVEQKEFELALEEYYQQSEWDVTTGIPTKKKLKELDLSWVADLL